MIAAPVHASTEVKPDQEFCRKAARVLRTDSGPVLR